MTPRLATLAVVSLLLQTTAPQMPRDQQQATVAGTASLSGFVGISQNGQAAPLRRARVIVTGSAGSRDTIDTDTNGRFRVDRLAAGTYQVVVDKPGWVPVGRVTAVEIKDGQAATTTVMMQRGGAIEGRLLTEDGEPAIGVAVSAVRLGYGAYGKKSVAIRQTTTDDLGRFRLHTLTAGEYFIEAAPDPLRMLNAPVGPGPTPKPAKTYFVGTPRLEEARLVSVGPGEQVMNTDFVAASALLANMSARVTTSLGRVPQSLGLRVQRVGSPPGEVRCFYGFAEPNAFDGFNCSNVPPGDFWLLVTARTAPNGDPEYAATRVSINGVDQKNLSIVTAPGATLTGRVEVDGGGPVPPQLQITLPESDYEFPAPAVGGSSGSATPPLDVAADGTFRFASIAGSRLVRPARLPAGWALKAVLLGDSDVTELPISFASGDQPRAVRVVITQKTGTVTGAVTGTATQPAAGARVVVFGEERRTWGVRSRFIQTIEVPPSGRYTISGLLPGRYAAIAVDMLDDGAWEDPDVLGRLQAHATPFVATADQRTTVDLRVR